MLLRDRGVDGTISPHRSMIQRLSELTFGSSTGMGINSPPRALAVGPRIPDDRDRRSPPPRLRPPEPRREGLDRLPPRPDARPDVSGGRFVRKNAADTSDDDQSSRPPPRSPPRPIAPSRAPSGHANPAPLAGSRWGTPAQPVDSGTATRMTTQASATRGADPTDSAAAKRAQLAEQRRQYEEQLKRLADEEAKIEREEQEKERMKKAEETKRAEEVRRQEERRLEDVRRRREAEERERDWNGRSYRPPSSPPRYDPRRGSSYLDRAGPPPPRRSPPPTMRRREPSPHRRSRETSFAEPMRADQRLPLRPSPERREAPRPLIDRMKRDGAPPRELPPRDYDPRGPPPRDLPLPPRDLPPRDLRDLDDRARMRRDDRDFQPPPPRRPDPRDREPSHGRDPRDERDFRDPRDGPARSLMDRIARPGGPGGGRDFVAEPMSDYAVSFLSPYHGETPD